MIPEWALGTPDLGLPAQDVARIVIGIVGGLSVAELVEPGSFPPSPLGEAFALVYAGLRARAGVRRDAAEDPDGRADVGDGPRPPGRGG